MKNKNKAIEQLIDERVELHQRIAELEKSETRRKQAEEKIKWRNRELAALNAVTAVVSQSLNLDEILNNALDKVLEIMNLKIGGIYLSDPKQRKLDLVIHRGISKEFAREIGTLKVDEKTLKAVIAKGKMKKFILQAKEVMKNPAQLKRVLSAIKKEGLSLTSGVNVLLQAKKKVLGLLTVSSRVPRQFSGAEYNLLISIGHQIAVAIENSQLYGISQRELAERKQAEEELKSERDKLQSLMEGLAQTKIGIDIVSIDYRVQTQSQILKERFGDITGKICYEEYMGFKKPCDFCPMIKAVKNKKIERAELTGADGKNYEILSAPFPNPDGTVDKAIEVVRDITEHKKAEEALLKEKTFTEVALNAQRDTFFIFEPSTGKAVRWNKAFKEISGYSDKEISLMKAPNSYYNKEDLKRAVEATEKIGQEGKALVEMNLITKDGRSIPFEYLGSNINDEFGNPKYIIAVGRDNTQRKKAEENIKTSLKEKELLLQEIHHRVKNNMQIMISLLRLQSANIKDRKIQEMFKVSQNRIRSMALIHERLYQSEDFSRIEFAQYIRSLTVHLFQTYRINLNIIKLNMDMEGVFLDINTAIPCSLIINELVSNSLKHAFPRGKRGEIGIKLHRDKQGKFALIVKDDGVGFPGDIDFRNPDSLGLQLTNDLVKQIRGTIKLDRRAGTTFRITF